MYSPGFTSSASAVPVSASSAASVVLPLLSVISTFSSTPRRGVESIKHTSSSPFWVFCAFAMLRAAPAATSSRGMLSPAGVVFSMGRYTATPMSCWITLISMLSGTSLGVGAGVGLGVGSAAAIASALTAFCDWPEPEIASAAALPPAPTKIAAQSPSAVSDLYSGMERNRPFHPAEKYFARSFFIRFSLRNAFLCRTGCSTKEKIGHMCVIIAHI